MIALKRVIDSFGGAARTAHLAQLESRRMELDEQSKPRYERVMNELHKLEVMMKVEADRCSQYNKRF